MSEKLLVFGTKIENSRMYSSILNPEAFRLTVFKETCQKKEKGSASGFIAKKARRSDDWSEKRPMESQQL